MELKDRGLRLACNWDENTPYEVVFKALSGIDMSEQHTITDSAIAGLPGRLACVYTAWKEGHDLRSMFSRTTFFRYRKELMKLASIDIAIKQPKEKSGPTNVIEFRRVLSPVLCPQVPDWAIGTDLYFEPRAKVSR
jgi:II/X family phage/plasmid replication protein